jgi:hypothetical protein
MSHNTNSNEEKGKACLGRVGTSTSRVRFVGSHVPHPNIPHLDCHGADEKEMRLDAPRPLFEPSKLCATEYKEDTIGSDERIFHLGLSNQASAAADGADEDKNEETRRSRQFRECTLEKMRMLLERRPRSRLTVARDSKVVWPPNCTVWTSTLECVSNGGSIACFTVGYISGRCDSLVRQGSHCGRRIYSTVER